MGLEVMILMETIVEIMLFLFMIMVIVFERYYVKDVKNVNYSL